MNEFYEITAYMYSYSTGKIYKNKLFSVNKIYCLIIEKVFMIYHFHMNNICSMIEK